MGTVATVLMLAAALATENELHVLLLLHKDHACSLSGSVPVSAPLFTAEGNLFTVLAGMGDPTPEEKILF